jgi:hypothetical protein
MKRLNTGLGASLLLIYAGTGFAYTTYNPDHLTLEGSALIQDQDGGFDKVTFHLMKHWLIAQTLNGKGICDGGSCPTHLRVAPGHVELSLKCHRELFTSNPPNPNFRDIYPTMVVNYSLDVQAGHTYQLKASFDADTGVCTPTSEDVTEKLKQEQIDSN